MTSLFNGVAVVADTALPTAEQALAVTAKILLVLVLAVVGRYLLGRLIDKIAAGISTGTAGLARLDEALLSARREQRARTTASVLRSLTSVVILTVAVLTVLDVLAIPVAPLLASAGIVGVAVGFGAQALVRDVISGLFMIMEDQYGVGDDVEIGEVSGTVESVGLRVTRLRDDHGTVWYLRNGEVHRVGNHSQGWARAVLDVGVAPGQDLGVVQAAIYAAAAQLRVDEEFGRLVLDDPQVLGVEKITKDAVLVRLVLRTAPQAQGRVARELRRRVIDQFAAEGIVSAYPADS